MESIGEGVPGYVTPKVAIGAVVGNDAGRDPARPAGRLGHLALPHRLGRRRLLAGRGGGQGGRGGDRHPVRAGAGSSPSSTACGMGFTRFGMYMVRVPLPRHRRRAARPTRWRRPTSAGSRRRAARGATLGVSGGARLAFAAIEARRSDGVRPAAPLWRRLPRPPEPTCGFRESWISVTSIVGERAASGRQPSRPSWASRAATIEVRPPDRSHSSPMRSWSTSP